MLNRFFFQSILIIAILVFLQVFIFNRINVFDTYNPLIYISWILFFPSNKSKYSLLILSFVLGFFIDFLCGTGGMHAFTATLLASTRIFILRIIMGSQRDFDYFSFSEVNFIQILIYIFIGSYIHHFALFTLENFKIDSSFFSILSFSSVNALITTIFVYIFYNLFSNFIN